MRVLGLMVLFVLLLVGSHGLDAPALFLAALALMGWMIVAAFARFVRWMLDLTAPARARRATDAADAPRACPDTHCGRINLRQARFCAQCGRRLA